MGKNKGYAKMALKKLLIEGKNIGMSNFLLTVDSNKFGFPKSDSFLWWYF